MTDEIIIDGVAVSEWTDEEVRYNFKKRSPNAIRQIAFDLYKQLKRKEQECEELKKQQKELLHDCNSCKFHQYRLALDDIEKFAKENVELLEGYHLEQANCLTILDIINKVKE